MSNWRLKLAYHYGVEVPDIVKHSGLPLEHVQTLLLEED